MKPHNYHPSEKNQWQGRASNSALPPQYWHQIVEISTTDALEKAKNEAGFALLGYACDEGVRRNLGRVGARDGANALRERLAKIPLHFQNKQIVDVGDIVCLGEEMEACQQLFAQSICQLKNKNFFPIGIGGGHDIAYAHYRGLDDFLQSKRTARLGIINFDAHFDLRPLQDKPNSGTPFYQILSEAKAQNRTVEYFALGIQQAANTQELFDIAHDFQATYIFEEDCRYFDSALQEKLSAFLARQDYLYISIDLDAFSSAYVRGVSAPSPFGLSPDFVLAVLKFLLASRKVISLDIAELNPQFDGDKLTATLAARIVDFVVRHLPDS